MPTMAIWRSWPRLTGHNIRTGRTSHGVLALLAKDRRQGQVAETKRKWLKFVVNERRASLGGGKDGEGIVLHAFLRARCLCVEL